MSELLSLDEKLIWHPFTNQANVRFRSVIERAQGAYVYDSEGKRYFDATSSWWCNLHGHCHPRLVAALAKQAAELDQILFAPHTHPVAVELARRLIEKAKAPLARVFYSDNGSTAVEAALKMSVQYWRNVGEPKRRRFLSLDGAYHGDTLGAVSVSQSGPYQTGFEDLVRPSLRIGVPRLDEAYFAELKTLLEERGSEIAALIVEPLLMGAAGMVMYPAEALDRVIGLCRAYGCLIIIDEVFTGFGRTGKFFAYEALESRPDLLCIGKGLTSGMLPLSGTLTTEAVFQAFQGARDRTFYHGHTFTANGLGCAVALESLKIWEDEDRLTKNHTLMACLEEEGARFKKLPRVRDVRRSGMVWACNLVGDVATGEPPVPADEPGWRVARALWDQGYWIRPLHDVLYLVPPYCSSESDLRGLFSVLYSELQNEKHFR